MTPLILLALTAGTALIAITLIASRHRSYKPGRAASTGSDGFVPWVGGDSSGSDCGASDAGGCGDGGGGGGGGD